MPRNIKIVCSTKANGEKIDNGVWHKIDFDSVIKKWNAVVFRWRLEQSLCRLLGLIGEVFHLVCFPCISLEFGDDFEACCGLRSEESLRKTVWDLTKTASCLVLQEVWLTSFANCTDWVLRKGSNLEKLYRSGGFDEWGKKMVMFVGTFGAVDDLQAVKYVANKKL